MDAVMDNETAKKAPKKSVGKASAASSRADSIVTARVPTEIKEQGNKVLKKIGATPTELINAAYQYVLEHGELPMRHEAITSLNIGLSDEQKRQLRERKEKTTCKVPESYWRGKSYKELLEEAIREKYETLD